MLLILIYILVKNNNGSYLNCAPWKNHENIKQV